MLLSEYMKTAFPHLELKAICNQDMGLTPRIYHRVYFINLERKTIFHVYDDRGCDIYER